VSGALRLVCRPSRILRVITLALHGLAAAALWLADLPAGARLAGLAILLGSVLWHLRPRPETTLLADADGRWRLGASEAETVPIELLPATHVGPWLTVIQYRLEHANRRHAIVVLPDSLSADDHRRLRTWLRWRRPAAPDRSASTGPA
jgi:toxin CptA